MSTLDLNDVTKVFSGGARAVDGVSLDAAEREAVVVAGPSGCGKTTLLRLIAGLERLTSGDIAIDGRLVNRLAPARRDIAMVFQTDALYPHMSVARNLTYAAQNRGLARAEIDARLEETAAALDLTEILGARPGQLSAGERRRVAIGRAIMRAPAVLLFDEPLAGIDTAMRAGLRARIRKMQRALGASMVFATHDQGEAMSLADRLVVMNRGRIEQIGAPLEVYQRPLTSFVAGFIGDPAMNLFPVEVGAMTGALHIERGVSLTGTFGPVAAMTNDGLVLGVRPEHITIAGEDRPADFRAEVVDVEHLGAATRIHLHAGTATAMTMQVPGASAFTPGDIVPLTLDRAEMHFFEARTGLRLEAAP